MSYKKITVDMSLENDNKFGFFKASLKNWVLVDWKIKIIKELSFVINKENGQEHFQVFLNVSLIFYNTVAKELEIQIKIGAKNQKT